MAAPWRRASAFLRRLLWLGSQPVDDDERENMVSVATLAEHYGQYRWTLERDSAGRFAGFWG
jgi:hypothetical protein